MQLRKLKTNLSFNALSVMYNVAQVLSTGGPLKTIMGDILNVLESEAHMKRGIISIVSAEGPEIIVDTAQGISNSNSKKGIYFPGEGITGKVAESGKTIIVPDLFKDEHFLNKTGARSLESDESVSFICVPIKIGDTTIGTLSVDLNIVENEKDLEEEARFLEAIGDLIAQMLLMRRQNQEHIVSLEKENTELKKTIEGLERPSDMIGNSPQMHDIFKLINQVAQSATTVLVRGNTGTGKELVAKAIHRRSGRKDKPFIAVNCAALPENLLESTLFGHEKGAFTGATSMRMGQFEAADGGTLFLDEIGEMTLAAQVRLLRAIQEKEFLRVGGIKPVKVDVRLITATNRDLEREVKNGLFREDLYYRINVFKIHLPPLSERTNDILLLTKYFIEKYGKNHDRVVKEISSEALELLQGYDWPGNIRELENVIERAILVAASDRIEVKDLPSSFRNDSVETEQLEKLTFQEAVENFEKELILGALQESRGNQTTAAKKLDLTKRIIQYKITKYGIDYKKFKN